MLYFIFVTVNMAMMFRAPVATLHDNQREAELDWACLFILNKAQENL